MIPDTTTTLQRANGMIAAGATDPGRIRDHNEDVYYVDLDNGTLLVVDGVGGQAGGDVAAAIAADTIRRRLERKDGPADIRVREAITLANRAIRSRADDTPELAGMACVLTLAVVEGSQLTIGHVGDSRLYKLDARGITKLTHDHSPIGELEDTRQISEMEAMLHERRNEVYRDVGSEPRDPDAPDFIELVQAPFEPDDAIVICSDGLSDMLPVLEINRLVRQHAGSPDAAAAALVAAANEVGGKDNITVVVAEGRSFRATPDGGRAFPPPLVDDRVPTLPRDGVPTLELSVAAPATGVPDPRRAGHMFVAALRSRAVALVAGTLLGLTASIVVVPDSIDWLRRGSRTLVVGPAAAYTTITGALSDARSGDVVAVEPGEYAEAIHLPAGVELRASSPGTVALVAPAGARDWVAITADQIGSTIRGVTIAGTPQAPVRRGVVIHASDVQVDDVTFQGDLAIGVEVLGAKAVVRSSRFQQLAGVAVRVANGQASVRQNAFWASADKTVPAIESVAAAMPAVHDNVFWHFARPIDSDAREDLLGRDNAVISQAR